MQHCVLRHPLWWSSAQMQNHKMEQARFCQPPELHCDWRLPIIGIEDWKSASSSRTQVANCWFSSWFPSLPKRTRHRLRIYICRVILIFILVEFRRAALCKLSYFSKFEKISWYSFPFPFQMSFSFCNRGAQTEQVFPQQKQSRDCLEAASVESIVTANS